jgi:hypothetical protein
LSMGALKPASNVRVKTSHYSFPFTYLLSACRSSRFFLNVRI